MVLLLSQILNFLCGTTEVKVRDGCRARVEMLENASLP